MIQYKGYCKDVTHNLPTGSLPDNAVMFRETDDTLALNVYAFFYSLPALLLVAGVVLLKRKITGMDVPFVNINLWGLLLSLLLALPHEFLHAICFPKSAEVSIYLTGFGAVCHSLAPISKRRFIFTSLAPAIVLGVIPLFLWGLLPFAGKGWDTLYACSVLNLLCCGGDFYNVYNALRQMPPGTYQQTSGFHSYWFYKE